MKLHELPPDHRLRNVALKSIEGLRIVPRGRESTTTPKTWLIGGETFNRLTFAWRFNYDFVIEPCTPHSSR